jgi:hypothetical protein
MTYRLRCSCGFDQPSFNLHYWKDSLARFLPPPPPPPPSFSLKAQPSTWTWLFATCNFDFTPETLGHKQTSVVDPWHFGTDSDPGPDQDPEFAFSSVADKMPTKNNFFVNSLAYILKTVNSVNYTGNQLRYPPLLTLIFLHIMQDRNVEK